MLIVAGVTALSPVAPMSMGTAQSHEFNAESNITINKQGSRFFGKVASSRGKCKKNRNVTLVKREERHAPGGGPFRDLDLCIYPTFPWFA